MYYSIDQFEPNEAWLVFRVDSLVADKPVDLYFLIDVASTYIFGDVFAEDELPDEKEVGKLMEKAHKMKESWPKIFYCPAQDPAEDLFRRQAEGKGITFRVEPLSHFESIIGPIKKSFGEDIYSPLAKAGGFDYDTPQTDEEKIARAFISDSYDLCSCASGLKYKFCCKAIFKELTMAMAAAEEGDSKEALKWMDKAKSKVGETAEVLCRYAIVYTFIDKKKADKYLEKCLLIAPNHPRANYVKGIDLKAEGDFEGAAEAYKKAIEHYPPTDRYHLNETWNNLGSIYYDLGRYAEAKTAWETALDYLPEDLVSRNNLNEFIYENSAIPGEIKGPQTIH